ncbi:tRNA pseudouridine(55) synthase TruB [Parachlamydia sp. AcF125]|uniref:tRNA pseudouridine(55) synthase TruB n=1 Tax=Parachlamydia sp. AcF125 TaxID=2795736 RepID=UPI001BD8484C|nr:tRNA pseudouridine(55) synthase TruB [Parachlamydia sp. AcF125]MBS4168835.1 tRNA pseudouridine synthase B [Parachlamydia sp. AcF125]
MNLPQNKPEVEGILLLDKPRGCTAFNLVARLRKVLGVKKIGHAGTLDPFATGVMVMLIGRNFTRLSDQFLSQDKEYEAEVYLGVSTDTYDCEGQILSQSERIPSLAEIQTALASFQGEILQIPPMFSAKKQNGKKLYELARQGKTIERPPVKVSVQISLLNYAYPYLSLSVSCSKGTYIRSLAHDLGMLLGIGAHLTQLRRVRSGRFHLKDCLDGVPLKASTYTFEELKRHIQPLLI